MSPFFPWVLLVTVIGWVVCFFVGVWVGAHQQRQQVDLRQAQATVQAQAQVAEVARTDVARSVATGAKREQSRLALEHVFTQLDTEAAHAPADFVDSCVLPDERLRRWHAANAGGADSGAAPGQLDDAARAVAATGIGGDAGSGGQPPAGGTAVPPAGIADLPAAAVPGDQP